MSGVVYKGLSAEKKKPVLFILISILKIDN